MATDPARVRTFLQGVNYNCDAGYTLTGEATAARSFVHTCEAGGLFSAAGACINVDECASSPCAHGGQCTDGENEFNCSCINEYEGRTCSRDTNVPPSDITLTPSAVAENGGIGTFVGELQSADANVGQQHTFELLGASVGLL